MPIFKTFAIAVAITLTCNSIPAPVLTMTSP